MEEKLKIRRKRRMAAVIVTVGALFIISIILPVIMEASGVYDEAYSSLIGAGNLSRLSRCMTLKLWVGIGCSGFQLLFAAVLAVLFFMYRHIFNMTPLREILVTLIIIIIPLVMFLDCFKTELSTQAAMGGYTSFPQISLLNDLKDDLAEDSFAEYTVTDVEFDTHRISYRTGRHSKSVHYEYTAAFFNGTDKVLKVQVSGSDMDKIKALLPAGLRSTVSVYEKSGFIRSISPASDDTGEPIDAAEGYTRYFRIYLEDGAVKRERVIPWEEAHLQSIAWYTFIPGTEEDPEQAVSTFGGDEFDPERLKSYDGSVCVYGLADGDLHRLSNIINYSDFLEKDVNK